MPKGQIHNRVRETYASFSGYDVQDGAIGLDKLKVQLVRIDWTKKDISMNHGPVVARLKNGSNGGRLHVETKPSHMIAHVNLYTGDLLGLNKTIELPSHDGLPEIEINVGKFSQQVTARGSYQPKVINSRDGTTKRLQNTEYSGEFKLRLRISGTIPIQKNLGADEIDAKYISDNGNDSEWILTGSVDYKLAYP